MEQGDLFEMVSRPAGCFYFKDLCRLSTLFIGTDRGPAYQWEHRKERSPNRMALRGSVTNFRACTCCPEGQTEARNSNAGCWFPLVPAKHWVHVLQLSNSSSVLDLLHFPFLKNVCTGLDFLRGLIPPRPPLCLDHGQGSQANKISYKKTRELLSRAGDHGRQRSVAQVRGSPFLTLMSSCEGRVQAK